MLHSIPEDWIGYRVCTNCGAQMTEGFYLNGEYACCRECAIALYGGDEEAWLRDMEEEEYDPGSTECFYTEWYGEGEEGYRQVEDEENNLVEEVSSVITLTCYRVRQHRRAHSLGEEYEDKETYFTDKDVAISRYESISKDLDYTAYVWVALECLNFQVSDGEIGNPKISILGFCGKWKGERAFN